MSQVVERYPLLAGFATAVVFYLGGAAYLVMHRKRRVAIAIWLFGGWCLSLFSLSSASVEGMTQLVLIGVLVAYAALAAKCWFRFRDPPGR